MSDKEFFDKYIMGNPLSFKGNIINHCRKLDKYDIYEWVADDELRINQLKIENQNLKEQLKQKEDIIKKAKNWIDNHDIDDSWELLEILDNKGSDN